MSATPRLSIITPVKIADERGLAWLAQALQSVQAQTFEDLEHILVDDNSPVGQAHVAHTLNRATGRDSRFKLYAASGSGGCSMARNQAAQMATAELLLPLDADDYLAPDTVAQFMARWEDKPGVFLYPSVAMFDSAADGRVS